MPCDLRAIQTAACTSGILKIQNSTMLLQITAQLVCEAIETGGGLSGSGSPELVVTASPGRVYVDVDTGDLWVKQTGESTNNGWTSKG